MTIEGMLEQVRAAVDAAFDDMVDLRRDLHRHPELSFEEHRTTEIVRSELRALGLEEHPCPTETGAVFVLPATSPTKRGLGAVMLRADIDALPVKEATALPFASVHDGVMHACGHDAHVAALIGGARALMSVAPDLPRDVVFVFQPGEEAVNGALAMIEGGLLERHRIEATFGCHVTSLAPVGTALTKAGTAMAGVAVIRIDVSGGGGHGAIDPKRGNVVLAAARLAVGFESVVAGMAFEGTDCVCSPGVVRAGTAPNVVPAAAEVLGTLRTFDEAQRVAAWDRLERLCEEVAAEFAVEVRLHPPSGAAPVHNDPACTELLIGRARQVLGAEPVIEAPGPVSASDDVSEFLARVPGCYFFAGAALADGSSGPHHSPAFAIDETCLRTAALVLSATAL